MIKTHYLSTCVPTHKVIQNKNKYIAHNRNEFNLSYVQTDKLISHAIRKRG